jgi:amidohydrolase
MLKDELIKHLQEKHEAMIMLNDWLHDNPEIGLREYKAVKRFANELKKNGFKVEVGVCGLRTAFRGEFGRGSPTVAFLCEYDALPKIGHACGHCVSGTASLYAAIALKEVMERNAITGTIIVLGTPGEENHCGKIAMVNQGAFHGVDVAMMVHAYDRTAAGARFLANVSIRFRFAGKATHAAAAPETGINALDAVLLTFTSINAMRQQLRQDARIGGIITHGGDAVNIVPDEAACEFSIRAKDRTYADILEKKVKNCAKGAALQTSCTLRAEYTEPKGEPMIPNEKMESIFKKNLEVLGLEVEEATPPGGSSDIGNVSLVVPCIHPRIAIAPEGTSIHTKEFADATVTQKAHDAINFASAGMAMTAIDLITKKRLFREVREEFVRRTHKLI